MEPYSLGEIATYLSQPRDSLLDEAIELSSPALAETLRRVAAGTRLKPGELRRASLSLARYQIRAGSRCTPFGLMAGAGLLRFDKATKISHGRAHRRAAGPDLDWLISVVRQLETDPRIRSRIRVQANNLAVPRGDRLTLSAPADGRGDSKARSVRHTAVVRLAMETAASPIRHRDLVATLAAAVPAAPEEALVRLLDQLVELDLLLTELRPPNDHPDPLGHVLTLAPEAAELQDVATAVAAYAGGDLTAPDPQGVRKLITSLHGLTAGCRPADQRGEYLAVDTALDVQGTLAEAVGDELAAAAEALWRIAPNRTAPPGLTEYHRAFLDRYGYERAVPLLELLDPERGLGAPAGYRLPDSPRDAPAPDIGTGHDAVLAELALDAIRTGGELTLDALALDRLTTSPTDAPLPYGLDIVAELIARDAAAVDAGDFRLALMSWPGSQLGGAAFGRFAHLLGGPELMRDLVGAPPTSGLAAHLSYAPHLSRFRNVSRTAHWLPYRVPVGTFGGNHTRDIALADLAVAAAPDRFRVFSVSRGTEVDSFAYFMLDPQRSAPNVARFLQEATAMGRRGWAPWQWGSLSGWPVLPRVRYGRTVLAPASWRCDAPALTDDEIPWAAWDEALTHWRERWSVPDVVRVGGGDTDKHLRLDLTRRWHRRLLRSELDNSPKGFAVTLQEDLTGEAGAGWLCPGARAAEVVLALHANGPGVRRDAAEPLPRATSLTVPYLPGGEWLYAKLYCSASGQRELLTGALPALLAGLPEGMDEWFFIRYADPDPHVRLRLHGAPSALTGPILARLGAWAGDLLRNGLARRFELAGYEPEYERYGGEALLPAAHRVFHADSKFTVALLQHRGDPAPGAPWFTAAVASDELIHSFLSDTPLDPEAWALSRIRKDERSHRVFRGHREALLRSGRTEPDAPSALFAETETATHVRTRMQALRQYGAAVHASAPDQLDNVLLSLLHMHHNRLLGSAPESERTVLAACRGLAQIRHGRRQAGR
ncbi:lantibiotic dehydratase [Streptomyces mirabilis]